MWKRIICEEWNTDQPTGRQVTRIKKINADFFTKQFFSGSASCFTLSEAVLCIRAKCKFLLRLTRSAENRRKTPVSFGLALVMFWSCFGLVLLLQKQSKRKPKEERKKRRTRPKQERKETVIKL